MQPTTGRSALLTWAAIALTVPALSAAGGTARSPLRTASADTRPAATHARPARVYAVSAYPDAVGHIVAPVMIDGRGPFHFMIDTGANRTVIARSALAKLGLSARPAAKVTVVGTAGSTVASCAHIGRLDAGGLLLRDVNVPVLSGPALAGADGILSLEKFPDIDLHADFVRNRLRIAPAARRFGLLRDDVPALPFLRGPMLMVAGRVGAVPVEVVIDTGAAITLGNPALFETLIRRHALRALQRLIWTDGITDATRSSQVGVRALIPPLQLGSARLPDRHVTFGDFYIFYDRGLDSRPALLLGMDVLRQFGQLDIDYRHREVQLLPRADR